MSKKVLVLVALAILGALAVIAGSGFPVRRTTAVVRVTPPPTPAPDVIATHQAAVAQHANKTVFLIVMENANWSGIEGSDSAPYINQTLLPMASYARAYYNPPGVHPSEPNYLWLEAGTDFGVSDDRDPSANHQGTTAHLVTLLDQAGVTWRSYQEDIPGTACPLQSEGLYAPKHNPMIYFDDVTGGGDPQSAYCIAHVRPFTELAADLQQNTVARYNFITPNLCDDMHNILGCGNIDRVKNGDDWLAQVVPAILNSPAYADGGVLIITWDEGALGSDGPIGLIVLSPNAKGGGYTNTLHYTHSSTLRTVQEIFGVTPLLGDAANADDLSDLFATFP
jgi:phosphatidylinositol-3-phosphatase